MPSFGRASRCPHDPPLAARRGRSVRSAKPMWLAPGGGHGYYYQCVKMDAKAARDYGVLLALPVADFDSLTTRLARVEAENKRMREALVLITSCAPWKYDYEKGIDRCRYCETPVGDNVDAVRHREDCEWASTRAALKEGS